MIRRTLSTLSLKPDEWPHPIPLRLLIYRIMHSDQLCEGGEKAGFSCPRSDKAKCASCGSVFEVDDTSAPGNCVECDSWEVTALRCDDCPVEDLSYLRANSYSGRLFERLLELEFDMTHLSVPWNEVTAEEIKGIQILKEERNRFDREESKRQAEMR